MATIANQVRSVQHRLLEAAHPALVQTTQLSIAVLADALELCDHDDDPPARVLALWWAWSKAQGASGNYYEMFPDYVRRRARE